jgi:ribonucleases P/MRP protein subunit RPP40
MSLSKKKACVTNLLACRNKVSKCINEKKSMDVLYTDFSKAFDKVSHKKLLHKLKSYGIVGQMGKWIGAFLRDRRQCVILGDAESSWKDVTSSVPQGTVLGPILFVIYINDLPDELKNDCEMYADDNKIMAVYENQVVDNGLQEDINNTVKWCDTWSTSLNGKKCKIMHFGKSNPRNDYYIEGGGEKIKLEKTEVKNDLGVMVAANGKCTHQVESAVKKANWIWEKSGNHSDILI